MYKSVFPLLVLPLVDIATLELLLEVAKHALGVAGDWRVDQVPQGIGQQVVLHARAWEALTLHTWGWEREGHTAPRYQSKPISTTTDSTAVL